MGGSLQNEWVIYYFHIEMKYLQFMHKVHRAQLLICVRRLVEKMPCTVHLAIKTLWTFATNTMTDILSLYRMTSFIYCSAVWQHCCKASLSKQRNSSTPFFIIFIHALYNSLLFRTLAKILSFYLKQILLHERSILSSFKYLKIICYVGVFCRVLRRNCNMDARRG